MCVLNYISVLTVFLGHARLCGGGRGWGTLGDDACVDVNTTGDISAPRLLEMEG